MITLEIRSNFEANSLPTLKARVIYNAQIRNACFDITNDALDLVLDCKTMRAIMFIQVKREEEIAKNPLSRSEGEIAETSSETLYRSMLPSLPNYMISLLKVLLAAAPTSKAKTESVNILADLLPEEMPTSVLQSMKVCLL